MLTVKTLKDLLYTYKNQVAIFSSTLDVKTLEVMEQESTFVFFFFNQFIYGEDSAIFSPEIISHIRSYFKDRWELLKKSNIAYTRHPFLPANQLCLKVAEAIAGPEEAICQILMPGVVDLNRKSADLKFETETDGHFELESYIINQAYKRLIPVAEIFQTAKIDSNLVIADFHPSESQVVYQLGGRDMLNLEQVAGKASETFFQVLKKQHRQKYDNDSIGFALSQLALELKKASVADSGSEEWADNEVVSGAIKTFYELWRKLSKDLSLPEKTDLPHKRSIRQLSLKSYGRPELTLESYLLALFVRHKDCTLTDEEFKRQQKENIFPCAYQISNCLFEFLNQNPDLYKIPLDKETTQAKEELPSLAPLLEEVLGALAHRSQMLDGEDKGLFTLLIRLVCRSTEYNVLVAADFIAPRIKNYEHFKYLTDTPELFKATAARVQLGLAKLPYMAGIHKLLLFFSDEQQQIIVESRYSELLQEYNTAEKYRLLMSNLSESVKKSFRKKYAEQLAASINSHRDLLQLKTISTDLFDEVFGCLEAKYSEFLGSYENTCSVLELLLPLGVQKKKVLSLIEPNLYEWLTPEKYKSFYALCSSNEDVPRLLAMQIKNHCTSFEVWKTYYILWKNDASIQELLLEQLFSQFKNNVNGSSVLFSLLKETDGERCLKLIAEFQSMINTQELFEKCLVFIPSSSYERFLVSFPFDSIVSSLLELQSVVDLFSSDKFRNIIYTQFTPEKLHCTEEEFTLLRGIHDDGIKQYHDSLFLWAKSLTPDELEHYITEIIDKKYAPTLSSLRLTKPVKEYLKESKHESGDN